MDRIVYRLFVMSLGLALAGLFCFQAVSAEETVKKKTGPAVGTPTSKQPAVKQELGIGVKGVPQMVTSDVQVLSIDSVQVVPPQAGSGLLQWVCRVKNSTKMVFQAPSVYVGGYQKTSQGQWITTGIDIDVGKIGPLATREYVQQFSISGNSTRFKIKIRQAGTVIKESQEIDLAAVQLPQVKIQSALRVGDGWDVTVKNEQSGYSPMGMILQIIAAKADSPTTWKSSGSWTVPTMAAQATYTRHFGIYLDPSYTIYKVRLSYDSNTLDEKNLNL